MAATQKLYPRGTVKRIVKAHSNHNVSKNADILVSPSVQCACQQDLVANGGFCPVFQIFLDYMLFMQEYDLNSIVTHLFSPIASDRTCRTEARQPLTSRKLTIDN
jgi:hypothetical protein